MDHLPHPILEDIEIEVVDSPLDVMEVEADSIEDELLKICYDAFLDEMNPTDLKQFIKQNTDKWIESENRLEEQNVTINNLKRQLEQMRLSRETDPDPAKKLCTTQNGPLDKSPNDEHNYALANSQLDVMFPQDYLQDLAENVFYDLCVPTLQQAPPLAHAETPSTSTKAARAIGIAETSPLNKSYSHPSDDKLMDILELQLTPPMDKENTKETEGSPDEVTFIDLIEVDDDYGEETTQAAKVTSSTDEDACPASIPPPTVADLQPTDQLDRPGDTQMLDVGERAERSLSGASLVRCQLPPMPPTIRPRAAAVMLQGSVIVSWWMDHPDTLACTFQIFTIPKTINVRSMSRWTLIGTVPALPLPMAVQLTDFELNTRFFFAVRAVDAYQRCGPFSIPCTWRTARR